MTYLLRVFAIVAITVFGLTPVWATTFSTNFGGLGAEDPDNFRIGPAAFTTSGAGATFGPLGIPELYSSNPNAWVIGPGGSLQINFRQTVTGLSFFAIGLDGATVTVFGFVTGANVVDVSGTDIKQTNPLIFQGAISGLRLENTSGLPNVGNFAVYGASIDDLNFTAIPEPAAMTLIAFCLLGMALVWSRTTPTVARKQA